MVLFFRAWFIPPRAVAVGVITTTSETDQDLEVERGRARVTCTCHLPLATCHLPLATCQTPCIQQTLWWRYSTPTTCYPLWRPACVSWVVSACGSGLFGTTTPSSGNGVWSSLLVDTAQQIRTTIHNGGSVIWESLRLSWLVAFEGVQGMCGTRAWCRRVYSSCVVRCVV